MADSIETKVVISGDVKYVAKKFQSKTLNKTVMTALSNRMLREVNKYVPRRTGNLKMFGYKIEYGRTATQSRYFKIIYRNTPKMPYIMYQYNGEVYGPNFPIFAQGPNRFTATPGVQTGWKSRKGKGTKKPMGREIGHRRTMYDKYHRKVLVTGYTKNRKAHKQWLDYVRNTPKIWKPLKKELAKIVTERHKEVIAK